VSQSNYEDIDYVGHPILMSQATTARRAGPPQRRERAGTHQSHTAPAHVSSRKPASQGSRRNTAHDAMGKSCDRWEAPGRDYWFRMRSSYFR